MRKGIIINDHDLEVLRHFYFGPELASSIFVNYFNTGEGTVKTHWRRMLRRLNKMQKAKLIRQVTDITAEEIIYLLALRGAETVCSFYGLDIDNAWLHSGSDRNYFHDLSTASLARRFIYDAKVAKITNPKIEFEHYMKKELGLTRSRSKGIGFPDFRVHFTNRMKKLLIYEVERDCGTVGKSAFLKKMKSSDYPLLIVTDTNTRASWLSHLVMDSETTRRVYIVPYPTIPNNIYIQLPCYRPPSGKLIKVDIGDECQ